MVKKNLYSFVLDCSITMTWCFEDESNKDTIEILESLNDSTAVVPSIWPLEVSNVLLIARRKKRITEVEAARFIDALSSLPIVVDQTTTTRAMQSIFVLASKVDLTIYDAAYLELAIREEVPIFTLDDQLIKAAKKLNVPTNRIGNKIYF